jgi:diguanylate cyclase (GGDEF)-like protein/PAS domain S-box-containing protein
MMNLVSIDEVQSIIDVLPNPVFVKNRAHQIVALNASACAFFGHSREALLTRLDFELFPASECAVFHAADDRVFASNEVVENEEQVTGADGSVRTVITRKQAIELHGEAFLVGVATDVSAYRAAEERNRYLAFHDILTALPNRALLNERIDQALLRAQRNGQRCALLYIDLDRFKAVNDTHGHQAGDELICAFGARLSAIVRAGDTVARLGGDEFAVLLSDAHDGPMASEVCRRILLAAALPFQVTDVQVSVGASIGLAFAQAGDIGQVELQRRADVALYQAKSDGRGCARVFSEGLDDEIKHNRLLEAAMGEALKSGTGLEVHYQPIIVLATGKAEGFEALARWRHPVLGEIQPGIFIPIAEESGLIGPLGAWVLARACADAALWDPSLRISVNVSPVQFNSGELPATVKQILDATGLAPRRLELEITEGVLIRDTSRSLAMLEEIRALGVQIVLDDFGTGYSSFGYFRKFPFNKIKIDRSFIAEMVESNHARAIVQAIISLARGLDLMVVGEGVERADQLEMLRAQGCTHAQGFLLGGPQEIGAFAGALLRQAAGRPFVVTSSAQPPAVRATKR